MNTFKYRPEVDGLRALAVLPVILFHAGFEAFSGGFVGVDVFFVISGYLISTIIISELDEGKFSLVNFYERRARRILPALFFVMAACLPFAWMWLSPADLKEFGGSLVAVSIFASNVFFFLDQNDYFNAATEYMPLLHTWSLAVEEQYYVVFPIFLLLAWRIGVSWIVVILAVVFVISLGAAQWAAYNSFVAGYFLLPTRGWELLIGVFAAFYLRYHKQSQSQSQAVNQVLSLLGLSMIGYSVFAFDADTPFPSLYALIPTLGTCLLILCAVPSTLAQKALSLKPLVGMGLISYSAYLWHQPLFAFTKHALFLQHLSSYQAYVLCALSFALAWFSWRFVERPFRNKLTFDRKQIFIFSIAGIIALSAVGAVLHFKDGFSAYKNKEIDQKLHSIGITEFEHDRAKLDDESWGVLLEIASDPNYTEWAGIVYPKQFVEGNPGSKTRLLVVGNSLSRDLFNVLYFSDEARQVFHLARFGVELGNIDERFFSSRVYSNADAVILAALLTTDEISDLSKFAVRVTADNKKLFIVEHPLPLPLFGHRTPVDVIVASSLNTKSVTLDQLRDKVNAEYTKFLLKPEISKREREHQESFNATVASIQRDLPQVSTLNKLDYACYDNLCPGLTEEGRKIYYSPFHRTKAGAQFAGERISGTKYYDDLLVGLGLVEPEREEF